MERSDVGSWIGGPVVIAEDSYRGARLGLPEAGPGSMAGTGRRVLALFVDWFAAMLIAGLITPSESPSTESLVTLAVFFVQVSLLVWLTGASFGQRFLGLRVVGRQRPLTLARAALRTALICLVIPPLVWDMDGRGLHDRVLDSVVVRA